MIHKVNILSTGTFLHKNFHREVMFLRNMQANYVSYKSTFVIEKPLPQNSLNIKQINSIFKILVHALSNLTLDSVSFPDIICSLKILKVV